MGVTVSAETRARTAIVVPDEAAWLMWGHDLAAAGVRRVAAAERAEVLIAPTRIPEPLVPAVRDAWSRLPPGRRLELIDAPVAGVPASEALHVARHEPEHTAQHEHQQYGHGHELHRNSHETHAGHGGHGVHPAHGAHDERGHDQHGHNDDDAGHAHGDGGHGAHGGHDHGDMMAIVGEPSRDGLVMEEIAFTLGPLAPSMPGGLLVELSLDGDVVAAATVRASLTVDATVLPSERAPDPLASAAWQAAVQAHAGTGGDHAASLARVEAERALSHAAWLRTLAAVLGWAQLADLALDLARALLPLRVLAAAGSIDAALVARTSAPERPLRDVERLVSSARLRRRLGGEGRIERERLRRASVGGPVARAGGLAVDARSADERYRRLDFAPQLDDDGDALARARVRTREVRESLRLLAAVATDPESVRSARPSARVEGPRGPLHVDSGDGVLAAHAPGAEQLCELAGEAIVGLELASAIAVLASFDLSPWAVDG